MATGQWVPAARDSNQTSCFYPPPPPGHHHIHSNTHTHTHTHSAGRETTLQRGLSRPEPNEASSPALHKDPPLKVQITHAHTHTYDSLCALGKRYARYEERTRIDKWKSKMDQASLDRPKEVYQWIQNEYRPPLVMLLDPDTSQPTVNIPRIDEILHAS